MKLPRPLVLSGHWSLFHQPKLYRAYVSALCMRDLAVEAGALRVYFKFTLLLLLLLLLLSAPAQCCPGCRSSPCSECLQWSYDQTVGSRDTRRGRRRIRGRKDRTGRSERSPRWGEDLLHLHLLLLYCNLPHFTLDSPPLCM